jgi:hypothetical protein
VRVFQHASGLRSAVDQLAPKTAYSPAAQSVLSTLRTATDCIFSALNELDRDERVSGDEFLRGCSALETLIDHFHYFLPLVEGSHASRVPLSLAGALEATLGRWLSAPTLLLGADWTPRNYCFRPGVGDRLRQCVQALLSKAGKDAVDDAEQLLRGIPSALVVVSLPATEKDNVLAHAALGHELGHAISTHNPEAARLWREPPGLPRDWSLELIADAWAAFIFGPAAFAALRYLAGEEPASADHPPSFLRLRVSMTALEALGFQRSKLAEPFDAFRDMIDQVHREPLPPGLDVPTLQASCEFPVSVVAGSPAAQTAPYRSSDQTASRVRGLAERLCDYVPADALPHPPSAPPEPADLADILNAGWVIRLDPARWERFEGGLSPGDADPHRVLSDLLVKSVESSQALNLMRRVRGPSP